MMTMMNLFDGHCEYGFRDGHGFSCNTFQVLKETKETIDAKKVPIITSDLTTTQPKYHHHHQPMHCHRHHEDPHQIIILQAGKKLTSCKLNDGAGKCS